MNKIELKDITKKFNNKLVLDNISISVKENKTIAILGPSGCGKTTLFNIISGIEKPNSGQIFIDNIDVTNTTGLVSYMLQKDLLLPYKTIFENVTLPLTLNKVNTPYSEKSITELFDTFLISETKNKFPHELSGGMRQRAAFLRAYVQNKNILLLDEPFSNLDNITKKALYSWYLEIIKRFKRTTLIITHDIDEAILLADTIYVMSQKNHKIINCINNSPKRNIDYLFSPEFILLKQAIESNFMLNSQFVFNKKRKT